jgi:hypothetical protein
MMQALIRRTRVYTPPATRLANLSGSHRPTSRGGLLFGWRRRRPLASGRIWRLTHERGAVFHDQRVVLRFPKSCAVDLRSHFCATVTFPVTFPEMTSDSASIFPSTRAPAPTLRGFAFDGAVLQLAIENQFAFEGNGTSDFDVTAGGASLLIEISHGIEFGNLRWARS